MSLERKSYQIRGVITLRTATHQTAPGGKGEQMKGKVANPKTHQLVEGVPIITANSVRGLLRRAASKILLEVTAQNGQISRNNYLNIVRGTAARTGLEAGGATYRQLVNANDHMFAGLFGGGPYMYHSKVRLDLDLTPIIEETASLIPNKYQNDYISVTPEKLIEKRLLTGRDDFAKLPDFDVVEDVENQYAEHMARKFAGNAAKRQQKAEEKATGVIAHGDDKLKTDDLSIFSEVEVIIPGTPLYFGMSLDRVTMDQAGLVLLAVQSWANANALGGGTVRGRGSFLASLDFYENGIHTVSNLLQGESPAYALAPEVKEFVDATYQKIGLAAAPETICALYPQDLDDGQVATKSPKKGAAKARAEA